MSNKAKKRFTYKNVGNTHVRLVSYSSEVLIVALGMTPKEAREQGAELITLLPGQTLIKEYPEGLKKFAVYCKEGQL